MPRFCAHPADPCCPAAHGQCCRMWGVISAGFFSGEFPLCQAALLVLCELPLCVVRIMRGLPFLVLFVSCCVFLCALCGPLFMSSAMGINCHSCCAMLCFLCALYVQAALHGLRLCIVRRRAASLREDTRGMGREEIRKGLLGSSGSTEGAVNRARCFV